MSEAIKRIANSNSVWIQLRLVLVLILGYIPSQLNYEQYKAIKRENVLWFNNKLRSQGLIPAILYGGKEPIKISLYKLKKLKIW